MNCPFVKYKNLFGIPGKGAHQYRFLDCALVDYILTIFLAIFISLITSIPLVLTTVFSFILGIILHILFGVETSTVKYLGLSC